MSADPVAHLRELAAVATRSADTLGPQIAEAAAMARATILGGGTIYFCGNGGSAADAQHMATEYVVRYKKTRRALRAIALTTDTSGLTAIGNDFSFDEIFARQLEAFGRPGDLVMIHTTSGNSPNCIRAAEEARRLGVKSVCLAAKDGGTIKSLVDLCIIVPVDRTDRAQEIHLNIQHAICELIDDEVAGG
jgi:D-sedoheptulose 7-phosphate isomerase